MPLLTFDNLNQNAYRYSDYLTYQRGMSYYQSGMVKPISKLFDSASVANLSPEGVHLFNLSIANSVNYTYINSGIAVFI